MTLTTPAAWLLTAATYSMIFLEASVFPAPLSPLMITQWLSLKRSPSAVVVRESAGQYVRLLFFSAPA